jgi:protein-L-isoaspartate(D-aspartate) O-methyltransferase
VLHAERLGAGYETTPDGDPVHLYENVLVAIDEARRLNNGEPATLARWIDELELAEGEHVVHVGCGVGYYTAILAELVGAGGRVIGVEIDPDLAARARENLASWPWVEVRAADGTAIELDPCDAILVNAGATHLERRWLDALRPGGRLMAPLTVEAPGMGAGVGWMLRAVRRADDLEARFVSPVGIFHCAGGRGPAESRALAEALRAGGPESVRRLRLDAHELGASCWLHGAGFCLSRESGA